MLKLVEKESREDSEAFNALVDLLKKVDGFVMLMCHHNKFEVAKFGLNNVDIVYACEYAKSKIFNGENFE